MRDESWTWTTATDHIPKSESTHQQHHHPHHHHYTAAFDNRRIHSHRQSTNQSTIKSRHIQKLHAAHFVIRVPDQYMYTRAKYIWAHPSDTDTDTDDDYSLPPYSLSHVLIPDFPRSRPQPPTSTVQSNQTQKKTYHSPQDLPDTLPTTPPKPLSHSTQQEHQQAQEQQARSPTPTAKTTRQQPACR